YRRQATVPRVFRGKGKSRKPSLPGPRAAEDIGELSGKNASSFPRIVFRGSGPSLEGNAGRAPGGRRHGPKHEKCLRAFGKKEDRTPKTRVLSSFFPNALKPVELSGTVGPYSTPDRQPLWKAGHNSSTATPSAWAS